MNQIWKRVMFLLPLGLWLYLVFHLSSQSYQQQSIQPFLRSHWSAESLSRVLPDLQFHYGYAELSSKAQPYHFIEFVFRKCAHLFLYAMLAICVYFATWVYRSHWFKKTCFAILSVGIVASLDEWNQRQSGQRTGAFRDVILDLSGGLVGLLLLLLLVVVWRFLRSGLKR